MKKIPTYAALFAAAIIPLHAASDLTNPLNTYSGNSQENGNGAAQPLFLSGDPLADPVVPPSGLEASFLAASFSPTAAFETIFFNNTTPPVGEFPGVKFGSNRGNPTQSGGNDGRNYMRTVEADYYTQDFTAYVTVKRSAPTVGTNRRSVFLGLGTGALNSGSANPDAGTLNVAAYLELQNGFDNASRRFADGTSTLAANSNGQFGFTKMSIGGLAANPFIGSNDSLRIRMVWNSVARQQTFAFDYSYDPNPMTNPGLVFTEDQTLPTTTVPLAMVNQWIAGKRSSLFFGGDRSVVFTDLVIDVTQPAAPPIPTGLAVASVGNQVVNLNWSSYAIPGTTFKVYRSTTPNDPAAIAIATGLTATTHTDDAVTNPGNAPVNGTTYYYTVVQSNPVALATESAKSNEVSATPVAGAITPSGVIAVNGGKSAVVVDWANLLSPFDTYTVRKSTAPGGPFTIPSGGSGLTESRYLDTNVVDNTTYYYTVTSTLGANESTESAVVSSAPRSLEVFVDFNNGTPTFSGAGAAITPVGTSWNGIGLGSVANLSDSTANLSSVGLNATGQGLFNKSNGFNVGGDNSTPGSATLTALGGFDLMQDYVFQNTASTVTYTLTGLVPDRKYDLYLYGYGDVLGQNTLFGVNGVSRQTSNPAGLTTLTEGHHYVTFTGVAAADGTLAFSWRNGFGTSDADASSNSGLLNGFQLVENASAVLQPTNLTATDGSSGVTLTWSEVEATDYKIFRSTTRASGFTMIGSSGGDSSFVDTTGNAGTTYYYVVKGVNVVEESTFESFFSGEVSGVKTSPDADLDGLSDANEALLGTDPNNSSDFFKAQSSTVTPNGANYNVSFSIRGAPGQYVIERSTTLEAGSWTAISSSSQTFTWNTGTVLTNSLTLSATAVAPAPGGKEFFRARGVVP
jgi:fibronectin type 3 domain-containing protein